MCYLKKVGDGIFIDSKCTGIQKIEYGYFVPEYPCGASFEAGMPGYHEDLAAFLDKWFPDSERWERTTTGEATGSLPSSNGRLTKKQTE